MSTELSLGELFDRQRTSGKSDSGKAPHLVIRGLAGSAKTTTLCDGLRILNGMNPRIEEPSEQQERVWDALLLSYGEAGSVCVTSFGKAIVDELANQVPAGVGAQTLHSMGYKCVTDAFNLQGKSKKLVNQYKTDQILLDLFKKTTTDAKGRVVLPWHEFDHEHPGLLTAVKELVRAVKHNLVPLDVEPGPMEQLDREACKRVLQDLVDYYDLDMLCPMGSSKGWDDVFDLVPKVIELSKDLKAYPFIDYDDMVWLPVVLGLRLFKYDLLVVDEGQDLNLCQQALAKMAGHRLVVVGDPQQSIYAFAGADCESMPRLYNELSRTKRGCQQLHLTTSFRCSHAVAEEARRIVPDFVAAPGNTLGQRGHLNVYQLGTTEDNASLDEFMASLQNGDMVVCRMNAPLVRLWRALRQRAVSQPYPQTMPVILGNRYGNVLVSLAQRFQQAVDMDDFITSLQGYHRRETDKERSKQRPSLNRLLELDDRVQCLTNIANRCSSVHSVIAEVRRMFDDDADPKTRVRLSTIHKSKGLEAHRVFFLMPPGAGCPHPNATTEWQQEQERNLFYVAVTRARESITYVH